MPSSIRRAIVRPLRVMCVGIVLAGMSAGPASAEERPLRLWEDGKATCQVILPTGESHTSASRLARSTLDHFLRQFYNVQLPVAKTVDRPGTYVVLGTPENNPVLAKLAR